MSTTPQETKPQVKAQAKKAKVKPQAKNKTPKAAPAAKAAKEAPKPKEASKPTEATKPKFNKTKHPAQDQAKGSKPSGQFNAGNQSKGPHAGKNSQQRKPFQKRKATDGAQGGPPTKKPTQKKQKDNPETVKLNKELAQFASRKQFAEANDVYDRARAAKLANSYTYVNMMNVCVRCGEMDAAVGVFNAMKTAKIEPDVVAYTTLLKGLCGEGQLSTALTYVKEMETKRVLLNVRTVNTLLRGCILVGAVADAEKIFDDLPKMKVVPDVSTWEYMIALCCRNLQLKKALSLFGKGLVALGQEMSTNPNVLLSIARAATILGDWTNAQKYLAMTKACLDSLDAAKDDPSSASAAATTAEGGKRGWGAQSETRQESLVVFLKHRREELRRELGVIQAYFDSADQAGCWATLVNFFKRVFLIPIATKTEDLPAVLGTGVLDTMGLRAILKKHDADQTEAVVPAFKSLVRDNAVIRMDKVFGKKSTKAIKMEICSGAGEWVVSQAKKDPNANWVALEIRHDRVYQIFTQAVFERVDNLCIVAGDASVAVPQHLTPGLVDFIFINFPEPPQQTGGDSSQAKHLLTQGFLTDCSRLLKPNGRLTIVTDNKWYAQMLLKIVARVQGVKGVVLKKATVLETTSGSFHLYMGDPPKECGVADTKSSSYFDRLAKQDSRRASQGTHYISVYKTA